MYQPLLEAPAGSPSAVVGDRLIGEAAGSLFGGSDRAAFEAQGGAYYPPWRPANANVISGGRYRAAGSGIMATWQRWPLYRLQTVLRPLTSLFPLLRVVFPFAVPGQDRCPQLCAAAFAERVTAISFHPVRMILAAAVNEGNDCSRVVVYDVAEGREECVLTHAFQRQTCCLVWKPLSRDVLAVGCNGGVLLWSLTFNMSPAGQAVLGNGNLTHRSVVNGTESSAPYCLFYRCAKNVVVTCIRFSCRDGRYLACGSAKHAALHFHDIRLQPSKSLLLRNVSVEGATQDVLFADDDSFAIRLVCGTSVLVLLQFPSCTANVVPTAAPVLGVTKARGLGPNYFFLHCHHVEGVFVAHINPFVGVHVIGLISTGIHRGVGGAVRCVASSDRRLFVALETGHLLVMHYGRRGVFTLIPVGTAEMGTECMAVFDGCTYGSLLAVVEADQSVSFVPAYHA
ncbi:nucleoporin 48 [Trypanosoma brucei equiperdum]|uniref:Nucleoporin 48 n=1 Tax=Trypanosoma brucei equiperdum TaxID=630700 RepID=A0A3L6KUB1_9TRYP|nr:nucleoporin 48 [Trypanosoma brucei equiperdum]